ncbi:MULTISPECIES: protease inhibitor I42 family protein [unclassified Serratia (in: enterobacteria)]|uniref:protease inhibitor I42 family protein n=1 Tax=unclassified Serratia (in: enterobacteria) TaxID=2647522 RepID=UPI003B436D3F
MKKIALPSMLFLLSSTTLASDMSLGNVVPAEQTVKQGESFQITLPASPTTGYQWIIRSVPPQVALVSMEYTTSSDCAKGMSGCRGNTVLSLTGITPGKGKMVLQYARPWELQHDDRHSDVLITVVPTTGGAADTFCHSDNIQAHLDDKEGEFTGMSQSGTLLVLRNTGHITCTLEPLPALRFKDAKQQPLTVERRISLGMHPRPVLLPPGQQVASRLRWVASDSFEAGNCVTPAFVSLEIKDETLHIPFDHMMCAAAGDTAYFDQGPLGMMK